MLSILLILVAFFMIIPVLFALNYGELDMLRPFLVPMVLMVAAAGLILLLTRNTGVNLSVKDGFVMVAAIWIGSALFGALPFYLSGVIPSFTDAFFETMSGFTTTVASILTEIEGLPKSMLFWRSLTHWLGGMGIVVMTCAILPILGIGAYQLIKAGAPGPTLDRITPKITATAKILWFIYLFLTVAETVLLMAGGMDLFDALTHTFGTLATGGFSPKNASVGHFGSTHIDIVVTVFMMLAGMDFILYYSLVTGNLRKVFSNVEMKAYLGIFAAATVAMALILYGRQYQGFCESLRYAGFQAATILTTTGYVTTDYEAWPFAAQIVLFLLMFVGVAPAPPAAGSRWCGSSPWPRWR